jgi:nucleolar protein 56
MVNPFEAEGKKFRSPDEAAEYFVDKKPTSDHVVNSNRSAIKGGYVKSDEEFVIYMNRFCISLTKKMMKTAFPKTIMITHSVQAIDEIDKIVNTLYERLDEMYSLYFPEAASKTGTIKEFVDLILKGSEKKETMGVEIEKPDLDLMKSFAGRVDNLLLMRDELSSYIEKEMSSQCKNLTDLCGTMLGARLLSLAGSLEKLARMPSSTIQVLGAEKALFRHLRSGAKPPKHGVILQHPIVATAQNRGRAARKLASKIAIAAKMDFYGKRNIGDELKKDLEEDLK